MKASVGAAILLFLLIALVILNAWYVRSTTDRLIAEVQALPDVPKEDTVTQIEALQTEFDRHEGWLRLTVNYTLIDKISELITSLKSYAEANVSTDYLATRALLLDAINDVGRLERLWQSTS